MTAYAEPLVGIPAEHEEDESETPGQRKERMIRYDRRDESLDEILAAYIADQLIRQPAFLRRFEVALTETKGKTIRKALFAEGTEWHCFHQIEDMQKRFLKLPEHEILGLQEALEQLFPKLRRGKVPAVARAYEKAVERATTGRMSLKPAKPGTDP